VRDGSEFSPKVRLTVLRVKACTMRLITLTVGLQMIVGAAARAQPQSDIELHWQGPADCAEPSGVLDEARSLRGNTAGRGGKVIVRAELSDLVDGTRALTLRAELAGKVKHRALTTSSCEDSRQTAAVLIALLLDSQAASVPSQPPASPVPAAQGAARSFLTVGVAGGLEIPTLASLSGVLTTSVGWRWGATEIAVAASLWLPVRARSHGVEVAVDRFGGALSACYWFSFARWELAPSLGAETTRLHVALNGAGATDAVWYRAAPGVRLGLHLSPALTVTLFGDLMLALGRPRFSGEHGEAAVPPQAVLLPRLGLSYAL
jgi:hypothetical protein